MDLEEIIKDYVFGKSSMEDMIETTGFSYNSLVRIINNYCNKNNVKRAKIESKLNKTYHNMYMMKYIGSSYDEIAEKYNSKPSVIKSLIDRYCKRNNISQSDNIKYKKIDNDLNLPSEEIYKLKKSGLSYRKIAEKYNCSWKAIKIILIKYCNENNIETCHELKNVNLSIERRDNNFPRKSLNLPVEKIYELKNNGMTFEEIADMYSCSSSAVRQLLIKYCSYYKINLPIKLNCEGLNLDLDVAYELKESGMTYNQIAMMYCCTTSTIRNMLIKYSVENGVEIPISRKTKEFEFKSKEIFDSKAEGMSYEKVTSICNSSSYIANKKLKEYILQRLLMDFNLIIDKNNKKIIYEDELEPVLKNEKSLV